MLTMSCMVLPRAPLYLITTMMDMMDLYNQSFTLALQYLLCKLGQQAQKRPLKDLSESDQQEAWCS